MLLWWKRFCSTAFNSNQICTEVRDGTSKSSSFHSAKPVCPLLFSRNRILCFKKLLISEEWVTKKKVTKVFSHILQGLKVWYYIWCSKEIFLHWVTFGRSVKPPFSFQNEGETSRHHQTNLLPTSFMKSSFCHIPISCHLGFSHSFGISHACL